jgi:hypothetical protein
METVTGRAGELNERLLDLVDWSEPQLRAVATTLLIKALDLSGEELVLLESMVASDVAGLLIDADGAAQAGRHLRSRLAGRLQELAVEHGESNVIRVMRDHLTSQIGRWATRAVDDADNRQRAERFLAWAERPGQLAAAQRRGLFVGMDAGELRRLADTRVRGPVTPENALRVWTQIDEWSAVAEGRLGDRILASWESKARGT